VHYVVDYDEEVGRALALGADIALNLPVVGEEACGTSWMKDIANFKVLISTPDGGVADVVPIECLEVSGDEQQAVYTQMANAATIVRDDKKYLAEVKRELGAYIETISGARMAADYLDLLALASLKNNR
jgi:glucan phosphorylase